MNEIVATHRARVSQQNVFLDACKHVNVKFVSYTDQRKKIVIV